MGILVFTRYNVELSEETDFPGDPAPYLNLRFPAAQRGAGRCGCGRQLPAVHLHSGLEEEDAVAMAHAILKWSHYLHAHRRDRERLARSVRKRREQLEQCEIDALKALETRILSD